MGIRLEDDFHCIESNVSELMQNIRTPSSLLDLETPEYRDSRELDIIDRSLRISAARWGTIYGYVQEQNGAIVQNLFPIKRNENEQISSSSKVDLEMHTETAFHPYRPDILCLLCVRGDETAGTIYVLLEDILEQLHSSTIELLHEQIFSTRIDKSFQSDDQPDKEIKTAVLFERGSRMTYDRALMSSDHEDGRRALEAFSDAVERCKKTVYLKTGQLLKIDNRNTIHGRTAFSPRYDGTDRWLKRVMVLSRTVPSDQTTINDFGMRIITTQI